MDNINLNQKRKSSRLQTYFMYIICFIAIGIFLWLIYAVEAPDERFDSEDVIDISKGWHISEDGRERLLDLPANIKAEPDEAVIMTKVIEKDEAVRNSVMIRVLYQNIRVYLNDELLKEAGYGQKTPFGYSHYTGWLLVRLPEDREGGILRIEQVSSEKNYTGMIGNVYMGTKNALVFMILKRYLPVILFNFIIMIISVLLFCTGIFFRKSKIAAQLRYLAIFAMITSVWLILSFGGYQLFFGSSPLMLGMVNILFTLVPVTCIRLLLTYDSFLKDTFTNILFWLSVFVFLLIHFFQITDLFMYSETIYLVHGVLLLIIFDIACQYRKQRQLKEPVEDLYFYISALIFAIFGLIDIILFYLGSTTHNVVQFTQIGLFLFFLFLSYSAVQNVLQESEDKIKQHFFREMAFTDLLTKLPNRNAFEEEIEYYRENKELKPLVAVADLNDLKGINDSMGHIQGDRAIIFLADILQKNFNDQAKVFRIGGDEFCIIARQMEEDIMEQKLQSVGQDIEAVREKEKLPLSAAIGWHKEAGDGIIKTFNQADTKMYEVKQKMKGKIN